MGFRVRPAFVYEVIDVERTSERAAVLARHYPRGHPRRVGAEEDAARAALVRERSRAAVVTRTTVTGGRAR